MSDCVGELSRNLSPIADNRFDCPIDPHHESCNNTVVAGEGASSGETGVEQELGARQGQGGTRQGVRQRLSMARDMGEGEPWLLLAMFGRTSITLYC